MQAIILAAGESSRFWPLNYRHKSLLKVMGKPLILHTIEGLKKAGLDDFIVVQGPGEEIEKELNNYRSDANIKYIVQSKPKGMGNAVMTAKDYISGSFFVVHAHKVNAGDYIQTMLDKAETSEAELMLLGAKTEQPWLYGILDLDGDRVKGLVEKPEKGKDISGVRVAGVYFLPLNFFEYYEKVAEKHYSFEDALSLYLKEKRVGVAIVEEDVSSLKYPWQIFDIVKYLMDKNLSKEKVHIGQNVKVFDGAVITGPCYIGDNSIIGNNALVRDYANIEADSIVGAHAEVARCVFQENTHVHSGFFGDSVFGKGCRVGAGTITGNVKLDRGKIEAKIKGEKINTGLNSFGIIAGENAKIGINVSLMPGVLIGSNSLVGPASVVFENIEDNTTFYTKFEKVIKKNK